MPLAEIEKDIRSFYGSEAGKDWNLLLGHLEFSNGFALACLTLPSADGAEVCEYTLRRHFVRQSKELISFFPKSTGDLQRDIQTIVDGQFSSKVGAVWLNLFGSDPKQPPAWRLACRAALAGLNQSRNLLAARLPAPLVILGGSWLKADFREAAPDLWSVRTTVIDFHPGRDLGLQPHLEPRSLSQMDSQPQFGSVGEAASDPDLALELALKLPSQGKARSAKIKLLLRASAGFLENGRFEMAKAAIDKAMLLVASFKEEGGLPSDVWELAAPGNLLLGVILSYLGRREEALEAATKAVGLYGELARLRPDAFEPDWAMSLNNQANMLSNLGRREEALEAATKAVGLYGKLAQARPEAFEQELAMSLHTQAKMLSDLGRREEALEAATNAVGLYGKLAQARPEAFEQELAMSRNNQANMLSNLGHREEALEAADEAVEIRRKLARARTDSFEPELAISLQTQAAMLSNLGRREEALEAATEAVEIRRNLAQARPESFEVDLARSLGTSGMVLAGMGRHAEGADRFREGMELLLRSVEQFPQAFAPLMAWLAKSYLESSQAAQQEPDMALLGRVVADLQRLSPSA